MAHLVDGVNGEPLCGGLDGLCANLSMLLDTRALYFALRCAESAQSHSRDCDLFTLN